MKFLLYYNKNQSGASAVEFALLSPLLIFLFLATVDTGFFIMEKMRLHNTARAAASYVAAAQDDTNVALIAQESYDGNFADVVLESAFSCECSDGVVQECPVVCDEENDYQRRFVDVTVSGIFEPIIPYPGIPNSLDLETSVRMRVD